MLLIIKYVFLALGVLFLILAATCAGRTDPEHKREASKDFYNKVSIRKEDRINNEAKAIKLGTSKGDHVKQDYEVKPKFKIEPEKEIEALKAQLNEAISSLDEEKTERLNLANEKTERLEATEKTERLETATEETERLLDSEKTERLEATERLEKTERLEIPPDKKPNTKTEASQKKSSHEKTPKSVNTKSANKQPKQKQNAKKPKSKVDDEYVTLGL